jgi:hypothetical protein
MMIQPYSESNPRYHAIMMRERLTDLIDLASDETIKVSDPRAKELFEKSVEILTGLRQSFMDYEQNMEQIMR